MHSRAGRHRAHRPCISASHPEPIPPNPIHPLPPFTDFRLLLPFPCSCSTLDSHCTRDTCNATDAQLLPRRRVLPRFCVLHGRRAGSKSVPDPAKASAQARERARWLCVDSTGSEGAVGTDHGEIGTLKNLKGIRGGERQVVVCLSRLVREPAFLQVALASGPHHGGCLQAGEGAAAADAAQLHSCVALSWRTAECSRSACRRQRTAGGRLQGRGWVSVQANAWSQGAGEKLTEWPAEPVCRMQEHTSAWVNSLQCNYSHFDIPGFQTTTAIHLPWCTPSG